FFPIANKGELAVFYCWFFFFVVFYGPGRWSIDALIIRGVRPVAAVSTSPAPCHSERSRGISFCEAIHLRLGFRLRSAIAVGAVIHRLSQLPPASFAAPRRL